jgi:lysozyme
MINRVKEFFICLIVLNVIFFTLYFFLHETFNFNTKLYEDNYEVKRICPKNNKVKGIDVSYYQGNIDWEIVKANNIKFVFIRVSDGLIKVDPKFDFNWKKTKEVGLIRGAYQFFRPNQDPEEQAKVFLDIINSSGGLNDNDLPCVLDIENTGGGDGTHISDSIYIWINYIQENTNKIPIIYTGPYFWELNKISDEFAIYPLWTAHYTVNNKCPFIPDPWDEWAFWQFTGSGRVGGVPNIVDINIYNGSYDELINFIYNSNFEYKDVSTDIYKDADSFFIKDSNIENNIKDVNIKDYDCNIKSEDIITGNNGCQCNIVKQNNINFNFYILFGILIILRDKRKHGRHI